MPVYNIQAAALRAAGYGHTSQQTKRTKSNGKSERGGRGVRANPLGVRPAHSAAQTADFYAASFLSSLRFSPVVALIAEYVPILYRCLGFICFPYFLLQNARIYLFLYKLLNTLLPRSFKNLFNKNARK